MDLIITILPVVAKDLPISPRFTPYTFLSRCKFSTLTTRQPMVEFYLLTFPRFPLLVRKKEHQSYFGKNRTHDFRTSRCAGHLLDHSDDYHRGTRLNAMKRLCLCSLCMIPPKRFDIFFPLTGGGAQNDRGLDAFRFFFQNKIKIIKTKERTGKMKIKLKLLECARLILHLGCKYDTMLEHRFLNLTKIASPPPYYEYFESITKAGGRQAEGIPHQHRHGLEGRGKAGRRNDGLRQMEGSPGHAPRAVGLQLTLR